VKQIAAKRGNDPYRIHLPRFKVPTFIVGIDVCHSGPRSVVGFCATTNKLCSQYFSEVYDQDKGKEIGNEKLVNCFKRAIERFEEENGGLPPAHIIVYRDGVGDTMIEQVISSEVSKLQEMLKKRATPCSLTYFVVNKKISQRFFSVKGGQADNPEPGTLIDRGLVNQEGHKSEDGCFDFFLVSQKASKGCIVPTHYHCIQNNSDVSIAFLEQLTFSLCFYYFNWPGSIKVPAPCHYAHRLAKYCSEVNSKPTLNRGLYFL